MVPGPLTCIDFKFPAPICDDCRIAMVTVTTIFHPRMPDETKFVGFKCHRCGAQFGAAARGHRGQQIAAPFSGSRPA
jgi:hypothetical protein